MAAFGQHHGQVLSRFVERNVGREERRLCGRARRAFPRLTLPLIGTIPIEPARQSSDFCARVLSSSCDKFLDSLHSLPRHE